jgi:mycothione reductase
LAHFYGSLGTKINIIQLGDTLIPDEDEEISQKFTEIFSKKYNVYLGYETESVTKKNKNIGKNDGDNDNDNSNTFHIVAENKSSKKVLEIDSDQLLIAVGRIPNSDILAVEKADVHLYHHLYFLTK